jgi:starch synthase (maltosyl-transferring)
MFSRADHGPGEGLARPSRTSVVDGRRRVIVAAVRPELDGGRFAVKRVVGDVLEIEADLLVDGHDILAARVLFRHEHASEWS